MRPAGRGHWADHAGVDLDKKEEAANQPMRNKPAEQPGIFARFLR
jgi:hypothetical protein